MLNSVGKLFGTDGVRGIANADLTPALALAIGRGFGGWLSRKDAIEQVLLARDTRPSGSMLSAAAAAGLCSVGAGVTDCGILPTPALCLLVREGESSGGIVLSASHNPPIFNGIKLINSYGEKLSEEAEQLVESLIFADEDLESRPIGAEVGTIDYQPTAGQQYIDLLMPDGDDLVSLAGLKVVMDCAFGAAFQLGPQALRRAGAEVRPINAIANGAHINDNCGATNPHQLAQQVVAEEADIGVAFDGDADRAVFADHTGTVRDGDFVKFIVAADLQARGLLDPPVVVGTVMSNLGLELALNAAGITLVRALVGDRAVLRQMKIHQALIGGEQSGHIIFAQTGLGDGIYTALRVCQIIARTGRPLAELCAPLHKVPQTLRNVPVQDKHSWERSNAVSQQVAAWEDRLADRGRLLIRPSGTEPVVRVMVEAHDEDLAAQAADELAQTIAREFGYDEPPSQGG